jgi:hypothetical protein
VLAGAGIFGKKYCATARQNGAVALDLGSAFDILEDKITRPVHSNPSIIDPNHGPWIKTKQAKMRPSRSLAAGAERAPIRIIQVTGERVPIKWNHLIGTQLNLKQLAHVGIEEVEQLFLDRL